MKVLIVEPKGSGHRMALYVRHVVRKLIDCGCELSLLTTRSAMSDPSYKLVKAELPGDVEKYFLPELATSKTLSPLGILLVQLRTWFVLRREFSEIVKINQPDVVYVPTMDWVVRAIEIMGSPFGKIPFVALYMSPKHHRKVMDLGPPSRQDWLYDKLFRRLLKTSYLGKLLVIDEFFYEFAKMQYDNLSTKIQYVPDFGLIEGGLSRNLARKNLGISQSSKVILVYGSLSIRKGIQELLATLNDNNMPKYVVILLAGRPTRKVNSLLETPEMKKHISMKRIVTCFKFHDSSDEQQAFVASDAVWLGYTQGFYGSSGVLYQAISSDIPVIGQDYGLIGRYVAKHNLGVTVSPNHKKQVVAGIRNLLGSSVDYSKESKSRKTLKELHSPTTHCEVVFKSLLSSVR